MAENLVVNGVVYNGVDSISMKNENGETVPYFADAVRYVDQELTEEQKAQARSNIGAVSAADVTIEGGSGTLYTVAIEGDADNGYRIAAAIKEGHGIVECTFNDVVSWLAGGDTVFCMYEGIAYPPLACALDDGWVFGATLIGGGAANAVGIMLSPDGTVNVDQSLTELGGGSVEIPEALPNPYALTFNQSGVITQYDGSAAKTVKIPSVPDALPNPHELWINNAFYNGSSSLTIDTSKWFYISNNSDGTFAVENDNGDVIENVYEDVAFALEDVSGIHILDEHNRIFDAIWMDPDTGTVFFANNDGTAQHRYLFHEDNTITYEVIQGGSGGVDEEAVSAIIEAKDNSVRAYGAKGDGVTVDTKAFKDALAANRIVTVPGGTYILSDTLVIRENCCLELSQDTVLQFTQTSGNCIDMRASATLRGNHAIISVPYGFTGNVIAIDTTLETGDLIIPPYKKIGSHMFKRQRFVYDVNIVKPTSDGFMRSSDGKCNGTAIYMSAYSTTSHMWMWALTLSGIRIAGGFSYGIRAINFDSPIDSEGHYEDDAWNHDMRIEAVIEACEIGVALENCNGAHIAVTIQPSAAMNGKAYAKHGFYLNDSKFIDMIGSRVWDWKDSNTLVATDSKYQHIALIGQCRGLILDDFMYYESGTDIRDLIYTNLSSNLEKMTILQEPITRWFKPVDGKPYFSDGTFEKPLMLREEMDEFFTAERIQGYANALSSAIDTDGSIYNRIGYARNGGALNSAGALIADTESWYGHTGFIACKPGDTLYFKNFDFSGQDGYTKAFAYDENFNLLGQNSIETILNGVTPGVFSGSLTDDGCTMNVVKSGTAYMRIGFKSVFVGSDPIISVNNEIKFVQSGFVSDGIKIKGDALVLYSPGGKAFGLSVSDTGTLTATEIRV